MFTTVCSRSLRYRPVCPNLAYTRACSVAAYNERLKTATIEKNVIDILQEMDGKQVQPSLETMKIVMNWYQRNWEVNGKKIDEEETEWAKAELAKLNAEVERDGDNPDPAFPIEKLGLKGPGITE